MIAAAAEMGANIPDWTNLSRWGNMLAAAKLAGVDIQFEAVSWEHLKQRIATDERLAHYLGNISPDKEEIRAVLNRAYVIFILERMALLCLGKSLRV